MALFNFGKSDATGSEGGRTRRRRKQADDPQETLETIRRRARNRLLGAANIRHELNDSLLITGGHIGDGIRPSERGKGFGTELVRLALIECKKLGIRRVLMTCDKSNTASAKTIIKNGGVLENEFVNSEGEIEQRYWITIK